jgi:hypothetical protein
MSNNGDEISSYPTQNSKYFQYFSIITLFILIFAVLWLYVEVGRIRLKVVDNEIKTLYFDVQSNSSKIKSMDVRVGQINTRVGLIDSDLSSLVMYTNSLASELDVVGALARNANMYAHSHTYSDFRLKGNITPIENVLVDLTNLNGVYFFWDTELLSNFPELPSGRQVGFIAQDVERVFPELVYSNVDGYKQIDYSLFTPILVEALKEQQKTITALKQENIELKASIEALESIINGLSKP